MAATGTSLTGLFGVGPVIAAAVIGDVRDVSRFPSRNRFADDGTAPIEVSSGPRQLYEQLRAEDAGVRSTVGGPGEPGARRAGRRIPADAVGRLAAGRGQIIVASVLLLVTGIINLAGGIAAVTGSHILLANAHHLTGGLSAWGWIMTIFGAVQLLAAAGVWAGSQLARWLAVAVVGLSATGQMFVIPASPFWSVMIIAADVVALWGLCAHGNRENPGAA